MFDIGMAELAVIGVVALLVIGPKELPKLMRTFGKVARKISDMMSDVKHGWDQLSYEAEIAENLEQQEKIKTVQKNVQKED
jgi:sec-independent protein translocase protein TatB